MSLLIQKILKMLHFHQLWWMQLSYPDSSIYWQEILGFQEVEVWFWMEPKGVWSIRTYSHKIRGKYTDTFNIEKLKIHMKHEPRGKFLDINDCTPMSFSFLGQEKNSSKSVIFFERPSLGFFLAIGFSLEIETQPKRWWIIWEGLF